MHPTRWVLLVLFCTLTLTVFGWWHARQNAMNKLQFDIQHEARDVCTHIERYLTARELLLKGFVGVFNLSENVSRDDFRQYYQTLRLNSQITMGVAYHEIVRDNDLPRHLDAMRKQGFKDYRIFPEGQRDVYAPLLYIEPYEGDNLNVIGFDPLTVAAERTAVEHARDTDSVTISAKLTLAQDSGTQTPGFVMYVPVYRRGQTIDSEAARQANFVGWLDSSFRMSDMVSKALPEGFRGIDLEIYDGTEPSAANLLFETNALLRTKEWNKVQATQRIVYGGRVWTLVFRALPGYADNAYSQVPLLIAASGTLLCIILSLSISWLVRAQLQRESEFQRQEAELERQTRESLRELNEQALQESEAAARQAADHARHALEQLQHQKFVLDQHAIVSTSNAQGFITYVNDKFCELSGYQREELIGQDHSLLGSGFHPPEFFVGMYQKLLRGEVWQDEMCNRAKDGHLYWIRSTVMSYLDENAKPTQYISVSNDITRRKAAELELQNYRSHLEDLVRQKTADLQQSLAALNSSEAKHRRLIDNSHDIIYTVNAEGVFTFVSPSWTTLMGHPVELMLGRPFAEMVHPDDLAVCMTVMQKALGTGRAVQGLEYRTRHLDGHWHWFNSNGIPLKDDNGLVIGLEATASDISARKLAEQALNTSLALLNATLESIQEGIVVVDRRGRIAQWNRQFVELWQVPKETISQLDAEQLWAHMSAQTTQPDEFLDTIAHLDQHLENSLQVTLRMTDGRVFVLSSQPQVVGQSVVGRVWSYANISELEQQKEALKRVEKRFELAVDGAEIGIWDINFATGAVYNSPRMWQMLGYSDDEFTPSLATWEALAFPGDFEKVMDALLASLESPELAVKLVTRYRHRNGGWYWIAVHGRASQDETGHITRVTGTHTDITNRKKMEAALYASQLNLEMLTNSVPGAVYQFQVGPTGLWKFTFISKGVNSLYEVSPKEVLRDHKALTDCILPEDREAHRCSVVAASAALINLEHDYRIQTRSGIIKWIRGRAIPKRRTDGSIFWNGILSDVTESKRTEQAAQAANLAKSEFLANMSHEIRTPMNGVVGMVDILQQTELQPAQRQMLDTIGQSSQALLHILNDILDYSKIEAGKLAVERIATPLLEVAQSVVQLMRSSANARLVDFSVSMAPELPHSIFSDPTRLRQVLLNLVGNALKFTRSEPGHSGSVSLRLEPGVLSDGQKGVLLRIIDNGIGISEDVVAKLFQPFTQADASTARRYGGTGLGLSISHRLVSLMGGEIRVQSTLGQGSEFTIALPWHEAQPALVSMDTTELNWLFKKTAPSIEQALAARQLILLAEDNAINRAVLCEQLRLLGYASEVATDGQNALEQWRTGRHALLLTDCHMPRMDGFELTAAIRQAESDGGARLPIIAVTASAMQGEVQHCLDSGMDDFLSKPLRLHDLAALLNKWLPLPADLIATVPILIPDDVLPDGGSVALAVWNASALSRLVGDNPAMHQHLLKLFLTNSVSQVSAIEVAAKAGQTHTVADVAHTLKAASSSVGAMLLGDLCQHIETAGRVGDIATCRTLVEGLANAFAQARDKIDSHLTRVNT